MGDGLLSSETAPREGYRSLERRAFGQDIDSDDLSYKAIRGRNWHKVAIETVKNKSGTNVSEVCCAAYMEGLLKMREAVPPTEINTLSEFRYNVIHAVGQSDNVENPYTESLSMILDPEIGDPLKDHGTCSYRFNAKLKDSAVSEVKDVLIEDSFMKPWVHRTIIGMGLGEAETVPPEVSKRSAEAFEAVRTSFEDAKKLHEKVFHKFLAENLSHWVINGMGRQRKEHISLGVGMMQTDKREKAEVCLNIIDNRVELVENNGNE